MNFDILNDYDFNSKNLEKLQIESSGLHELLNHLKNDPEYDFDRLNTIIGIDLGIDVSKFELIYDLHSTKTCKTCRVSTLIDRNTPQISSVVDIYRSAYFDECEIYDLLGIKFDNNPNLKRLLMPKGWKGYPLRKDYVQDDTRLSWNIVKTEA